MNHSAQPPATLQCCSSYLGKDICTLAGVCALWLLLRCSDKQKHQPAVVTLMLLSHYIQQIMRQNTPFPASHEPQCTASCHFAVLLVIPRGRALHPGRCVCIVVAEMPGQERQALACSSHPPCADEPLHTDNKADCLFPCIS
jgi:hypothetical protein